MTTDQDKQQAIEDYFRALAEAKGTQFRELIFGGYSEFECLTDRVSAVRIDGIWVRFESLPNIIDDFPSFKKWVLERMEGEGYRLNIFNGSAVSWGDDKTPLSIEDGEITLAAVKAATRYWREKDAKGS